MGWTTWGVALAWSVLVVLAIAIVGNAAEEPYRSEAELSEREKQILDVATKAAEASKEGLF